MSEFLQQNADDARILRIGLEQHDPQMVDVAHQRISKRFGKTIADSAVFSTITRLVNKGWSFFDKDGNPSPLLNHELPE